MGRRTRKWNGPTIKEMRTRLGLSQGTFAARFGVPRRTIIAWELYERRPDASSAREAPFYVYKLLNEAVLSGYQWEPIWRGPSIIDMRRDLQLTQKKFCEKTGVGTTALEGWERAEREPDATNAHKPAPYVYPLIYWFLYGHPY